MIRYLTSSGYFYKVTSISKRKNTLSASQKGLQKKSFMKVSHLSLLLGFQAVLFSQVALAYAPPPRNNRPLVFAHVPPPPPSIAELERKYWSRSSFNDVVSVMERNPYDVNNLPVIPAQMFKWVGNKLVFFVGQRSEQILTEKKDYRETPMNKPIHPMGIGLTGITYINPSNKWSGIFKGGVFRVAARASISQDNPYKVDKNGKPQKRSTALALKIFNNVDGRIVDDQVVRTGNAVFQNNLNGLLRFDNEALNYLESAQTNMPAIDFTKISQLYEVETLLGVAFGSIVNSNDRMTKVPFINPQIRPVHTLAEMGETNRDMIKTPTWVMIRPKMTQGHIKDSDFRVEIYKTLQNDGKIEYELYAADELDRNGKIQWKIVGAIVFNKAYLSEGVDKNLLFPHDTLNSKFTGEKFQLPKPNNGLN